MEGIVKFPQVETNVNILWMEIVSKCFSAVNTTQGSPELTYGADGPARLGRYEVMEAVKTMLPLMPSSMNFRAAA